MKVLFGLVALLFSGLVAATPLHNIIVFGDSLSDNGNLYEYMRHQVPQSPPYYQGRFTNGPVWVERLAAMYFPADSNAHLSDYAFGGAGISEEADDDALFTLKREMDTYLLAHEDKADENNLYIIWIGANNYLGIPEDKESTLERVNKGTTHALQRLADAGAKHILILNLPDMGRTPVAREFDAEALLTYYSQHHNEALASAVADMQRLNPTVQWMYLDINHMFDDVFLSPENYGFTNTTDTCYDLVMEPSQQSVLRMASNIKLKKKTENCEGYLFFDPVHPSAKAHQLIAERAKNQLDAAGIEFINQ